MKKENIIIGAIAIIGALTLVNTYQLFGKKNKRIPVLTADSSAAAIPNAGSNFPSTNTQPNFQDQNGNQIQQGRPTEPQAQPQPVAPTGPLTTMNFKKSSKKFGKIMQNSTNKYTFEFTNTGTEPLIISNAKGSCGCTVPVWPREPIAPGETGKIDVEYKPGLQSGSQTKVVTVTANTDPAVTTLQISAEVQIDPNAKQPTAQPQQPGQPLPFEGGTVQPM